MNAAKSSSSSAWRVVRAAGLSLGMTAVVVLLMLWLIGVFHPKIDEHAASASAGRPIGGAVLATTMRIEVPLTESAVGTIRPVHEVAIAAKLLAKVHEINVRAGEAVKAGQVLVRLDDADLKARRQQAAAAVAVARAARDQSKIEFERVKTLRDQNAASQIEYDRVSANLQRDEAELLRAQQQLEEADTVLGYATIVSPIDGVVIDKSVEVGDTVTPGQMLIKLYDATRMQLIASVRESLTQHLEPGQMVPVEIESLNLKCEGRISEIVPEAQSASRTFSVKVTGPCPEGVYPNMFGRLIVPLGTQEVLVIPRRAVSRVGQLTMVEVALNGTLHRRAVQLGRTFGGNVEVLSGLVEGERVAEQSASSAASAAVSAIKGA